MSSSAVTSGRWFDRAPIIELLAKRVLGLVAGYRQNVALIGRPAMGKTTIVLRCLRDMPQAVLPLYVACNDEPFSEFLTRCCRAILYYALRFVGREPSDTLDDLEQQALTRWPETVAAIRPIRDGLAKGVSHNRLLADLIHAIVTVQRESQRPVVLIWDEFHRLDQWGLRDPFAVVGKHLLLLRQLMCIVTSSRPVLARQILSSRLQLLFGQFEVVDVAPIPFGDSRDWLTRQLTHVCSHPQLHGFLAGLCQGHPIYLDVLTDALNSRAFAHPILSPDTLPELLADTCCDLPGRLQRFWLDRLAPLAQTEQQGHLEVLAQIACGERRRHALAASRPQLGRSFGRMLERLSELDLIERHCGLCTTRDPFFDLWLCEVFVPQRTGVDPDPRRLRSRVAHAVARRLQRHLADAQVPLAGRVAGLLRTFANDWVEIGTRRQLLPRFESVTTERLNPRTARVTGMGASAHWNCVASEHSPSDSDIERWWRSRPRTSGHRRMLIHLDALDLNARLVAKERHIGTWGRDDVNLLCNLYGHSPLV